LRADDHAAGLRVEGVDGAGDFLWRGAAGEPVAGGAGEGEDGGLDAGGLAQAAVRPAGGEAGEQLRGGGPAADAGELGGEGGHVGCQQLARGAAELEAGEEVRRVCRAAPWLF
jgi:hypothetical protein